MSIASVRNRNATYQEILPTLSVTKRLIVEELQRVGSYGATRHDLAAAIHSPLSSICGRIVDLEKEGLVVSSDRVRPTEFGKSATVVLLASNLLSSGLVQRELF